MSGCLTLGGYPLADLRCRIVSESLRRSTQRTRRFVLWRLPLWGPQADMISPKREVEANGAGLTQQQLRSCVIGRFSKRSEMYQR